MTTPTLTAADTDSVRTLTLNRPQVGNALDADLIGALTEAVETADADEQVRAIILTGAGDSFCTGLDLVALRAPDWDPTLWNTALHRILDTTTPIIAAVNGPANTAGLGLVLACDFALAAEKATFVDLHAKVGLISASGMSTLLADRIGLPRAKEMWLTARSVDAATAYRWGLVNDVLPPEDLATAAAERARAIARASAAWVRTVVATHDQGKQAVLQPQFAMEAAAAAAWAAEHRGPRNAASPSTAKPTRRTDGLR
ncbi:enoyl-CoA hydratase/isomerase family protein [Yinghuangia sp. YIM S09857]|uniref:enoyl-CoA hydratase/isomerase family protein n=1 Tax=Yinghuangia sp. YIM S09857 TaxID=3436929 RepID=UPI003F5295C8